MKIQKFFKLTKLLPKQLYTTNIIHTKEMLSPGSMGFLVEIIERVNYILDDCHYLSQQCTKYKCNYYSRLDTSSRHRGYSNVFIAIIFCRDKKYLVALSEYEVNNYIRLL